MPQPVAAAPSAECNAGPALAGISFDWSGEPPEPEPLFSSGRLSVHHVAAGTRPHSVKMQRPVHTLLLFDEGSFSDGGRRIDGVFMGGAGALDAGVDLLPAGAELAGWTGTRTQIGLTVVSVDAAQVDELCEEVTRLRVGMQLRNELLRPLAARIRRWSAQAWRDVDPRHAETALLLLLHEIVELQRHSRDGAPCVNSLSFRAQHKIRQFVAEHLESKIDLKALANQVGMSQFHFARAFKSSFGVSPHQYVIGERIRKAAELMRESRASITDIALSVGFSCSSELSRSFRQTVGCAPRDYRAGVRAGETPMVAH
jgi:AraC family transcriptional regulator